MAIAVEDLLRCKFQRYMHADGSDRRGKFFMEFSHCAEHPRIARVVTTYRRGGAPEVGWLLDGQGYATAEELVAAYAAAPLPPTTPVERAALVSIVGDDWTEQQGFMPQRLVSLTEKGLIEWREGPGTSTHCRRTDLARQVLAEHYRFSQETE